MNEAGLDPNGSNPNLASRTSSGVLNITSGDGIDTVIINGVNVTGGGGVLGDNGGILTITVDAGGVYHYSYELMGSKLHTTPGPSADGVKDDFSVVVVDPDGDSAQATLSISILDDVPAAWNDSILAQGNTDINGDVIGNVLTNDVFGADGKGGPAGDGKVTLADIGTANGNLVLNTDGSFAYTPDAADGNEVSFQYQITDGDGDTSTAWATITLVGPSVLTPDLKTTPEDTAATGNVLGNDSNPGLVTTFEVDSTVYNAGDTATFAEGELTINSDGSYTFDPHPNYSGPVPQITYNTSSGESSTLDITVTPVADQPIVAVTLGDLVVPAGNTTIIHTGTVERTDLGYKVEAYNADGSLGAISKVNYWSATSVNGFGVAGKADPVGTGSRGDPTEIGYNHTTGQSEVLKVIFDDPVASATVTFAWLAIAESARYVAYGADGVTIVAQGVINGISDYDTYDTLTREVEIVGNAAIKHIEFSAVGNVASISPTGDDYLIRSIEFVAASSDPSTLPVEISVKPADQDGSESITQIFVTVAGGTLSVPGGVDNGSGSWTYTLTESGALGGDYTWSVNAATGEVTIKDGSGNDLSISVSADHVGDVTVDVGATVVDIAPPNTDTETFDPAGSVMLLHGTSGNDVLVGGEGNDVLVGSAGSDVLMGGDGADTFVWHFADKGTPGFNGPSSQWVAAKPAVDTVTDFNMDQGDRLDLRDLLQGETDDASVLTKYLSFQQVGNDTVIHVNSSGVAATITSPSDGYGVHDPVDQKIVLQNVTLDQLASGGATDDQSIIQNMLTKGNLLVDH